MLHCRCSHLALIIRYWCREKKYIYEWIWQRHCYGFINVTWKRFERKISCEISEKWKRLQYIFVSLSAGSITGLTVWIVNHEGMLIIVHGIILNSSAVVDKIVNMPTRYRHSILQFLKYLCKLSSCSDLLLLRYGHLTVFISRFTLDDKTRLKLEEFLRKTDSDSSQLITQSGNFFSCIVTACTHLIILTGSLLTI